MAKEKYSQSENAEQPAQAKPAQTNNIAPASPIKMIQIGDKGGTYFYDPANGLQLTKGACVKCPAQITALTARAIKKGGLKIIVKDQTK